MSGNPGKSKWLYSKLFEQISIAFQRLLLEPLKTLESLCLYLEEEEHKSPSTLIRWLKDLNVFVSWGSNRLRTNLSNHHLSSSLKPLFILFRLQVNYFVLSSNCDIFYGEQAIAASVEESGKM